MPLDVVSYASKGSDLAGTATDKITGGTIKDVSTIGVIGSAFNFLGGLFGGSSNIDRGTTNYANDMTDYVICVKVIENVEQYTKDAKSAADDAFNSGGVSNRVVTPTLLGYKEYWCNPDGTPNMNAPLTRNKVDSKTLIGTGVRRAKTTPNANNVQSNSNSSSSIITGITETVNSFLKTPNYSSTNTITELYAAKEQTILNFGILAVLCYAGYYLYQKHKR